MLASLLLIFGILAKLFNRFNCDDGDETKSDIADIATKEANLNLKYKLTWDEIIRNSNKEKYYAPYSWIGKAYLEKDQMLSALHERFMAIRLNLISWQCAWYYGRANGCEYEYKLNPRKKCRYYQKCKKVGELMDWYNLEFPAQQFVKMSQRIMEETVKASKVTTKGEESPCEQKKEEKFDYEKLARKTDIVLQRMKYVNSIMRNADFTTIYEFTEIKLKNQFKCQWYTAGLSVDWETVDEQTPDDEIFKRITRGLCASLGFEYIDIFNYWLSFLGKKYQIKNCQQLIEPFYVAEKQYQSIIKLAKTPAEIPKVEKILNAEYQLIFAKADAEKLHVRSKFQYEEWTVKKKDNGVSDYQFFYRQAE